MARAKKEAENLTVNIKSMPIKAHAGASKYINDDWGTIAFFIPRNSLGLQFADIELQYNCIYFLVGFRDLEWLAYVGQAKKRNSGGSVLKRLREHADSTTEKYRDDWDWVIVVTNKDDAWGLDDLNALENAFYHEIPTKKNLNGNTPNSAGADFNSYIDKIKQIKAYIAILGFDIFEQTEDIEKVQVTSVTNEYTIVEDLQNGMARIPEIVTPQRVVKDMVDMLEKENPDIWSPDKTFLDPACKGGEYLYEIYTRLMESETMKAKFPSDIARAFHILQNQVYGIALSQVSLDRTVNKLNGFGQNIKIIPNYISILKSKDLGTKADGKAITFKDKISEVFGKDMKFDVVIGNPPYQDERASIYPKFINLGISISNITCMITRDNWMQGKAFRELRKNLTENGGIKTIIHYPVVSEVFKGVSVAVAVLLWKKDYTGDTSYTCIRHGKRTVEQKLDITEAVIYKTQEAKKILDKVGDRHTWAQAFQTRSYPFMDQRKRYLLDTSLEPTEDYNVAVISNDGITEYTNIGNFRNVDEVQKYKVLCGVIVNEASTENPGNVLTNIKAIGPYVVSSETWSLIATFSTEEETINCKKYIKTRLVRFIANQSVNGRSNVTDNTFEFVPLQDFTSNSDIDWSTSIAEIDQQLYKKYGLSSEEIEYIEKTIKPMES